MTFFLAKPPTTHALLTEILARLSQLETQGKKRDEQFDRIIALQRRLLGKIRPSAEELRLQLEAARYPLSEYLERRQREAEQFMSHPSTWSDKPIGSPRVARSSGDLDKPIGG